MPLRMEFSVAGKNWATPDAIRSLTFDSSLSLKNRVQERIPLVIMPNQRFSYSSLTLYAIKLVLLIGIANVLGSSSLAQEAYYGTATTGVESVGRWHWWPSWHFRSDGFPRYGRGFASSTRDHQTRIPVIPPISGPSYGFYQPCWRQIPMVRRCVTCETIQPNREVPATDEVPSPTPTPEATATPAATPVPPAPGTSSTAEPSDSEPETESPETPELPEAEPTP